MDIKYLLQLADNSFIHSHRLGEWCGHAPALEIDIALTNIALDHIGAATSLYEHAAMLQGGQTTADYYPFLRLEREFCNTLLVEMPNGDFAQTIAKCFFLDQFLLLFYSQLTQSKDEFLAGFAQKTIKEIKYHTKFSQEWLERLALGTTESAQKMQTAILEIWPYTGEMFMPNAIDTQATLDGYGVDIGQLHATWQKQIKLYISQAGLELPADTYMHQGGKNGTHSEEMGFMLSQIQYLQRTYPGASW